MLSLLLVDIDHFKSINDRFGHQVGDDVIVHLANLACGCKRRSNVLARIGGEEFALLLPETDEVQALTVTERLRLEVSSFPLAAVQGALTATVSVGIAGESASMPAFSHLMRAADDLV